MKETNVHDHLSSLVPPPSRELAMPDLVARARSMQRRRAAVVASASIAVVAALVVATPGLHLFEGDENSSTIAAKDPGSAGSLDYAGAGSTLDCSRDEGMTTGTVYAPPVLETPWAALEEELRHRKVTVTVDDFTKTHETGDEVRYEVRRDEEVLALAVASRSGDGWILDVLLTCASLDE